MQLSELADAVEGVEFDAGTSNDPAIESLAIDSREVEAGTLFVALVGERFDGHEFVDEAIASGAAAALVESGRTGAFEWSGPLLEAEDTRRVLGHVSAHFYGHPSRELEVVGVTGTNGKTTTTHILESIFEAAGREVGRVGTVDTRWGDRQVEGPNTTPESAVLQRLFDRMRDDGVESVVMEVSSHGLATHRLRGTAFDCGVFTNFSQDHLDFHGDLETYRRVKQSFFTEVLPASAGAKSPVAALNTGDETGRTFAGLVEDDERVAAVAFRCGRGDADVLASVESRSLSGTELRVESGGGTFRVESPLLGDFNVENAAAATAASLAEGIDASDIVRGIEELDPVPGRLERVDAGHRGPAVFVDYAHSPDALRRVLETLRPLATGDLVAVFGCGGDRDREKRPEMGRIGEQCADRIVLTSDNPRSEAPEAILGDVLDGMSTSEQTTSEPGRGPLVVDANRGDAIDRAVREADAGDVVIIAGKGHEQYQEIGGRRRPFDDRNRAEQALEQSW